MAMKLSHGWRAAVVGAVVAGLSGCGPVPSPNAVWHPAKAWEINVYPDAGVRIAYDGWGAQNPSFRIWLKPNGRPWRAEGAENGTGSFYDSSFSAGGWQGP